jgi:hypothetical protein
VHEKVKSDIGLLLITIITIIKFRSFIYLSYVLIRQPTDKFVTTKYARRKSTQNGERARKINGKTSTSCNAVTIINGITSNSSSSSSSRSSSSSSSSSSIPEFMILMTIIAFTTITLAQSEGVSEKSRTTVTKDGT